MESQKYSATKDISGENEISKNENAPERTVLKPTSTEGAPSLNMASNPPPPYTNQSAAPIPANGLAQEVIGDHLVFVETILFKEGKWKTPFLCDTVTEPPFKRFHHAQHKTKIETIRTDTVGVVSIQITPTTTFTELGDQLLDAISTKYTSIEAFVDAKPDFELQRVEIFDVEIVWEAQTSMYDGRSMKTELKNERKMGACLKKMRQRNWSDRFVLKLQHTK